ncbi:MAG: alpha/beta fold hydrolase [Magnetospirillum sp.]
MSHRQARAPSRPETPESRLGPRPLPLHLLAHVSTLMGSRAALPLWKNGLLPWNPKLAGRAADLKASLDAAGPDGWTLFEQAIAAESLKRHQAVLDGVGQYRAHQHHRHVPEVPVLWRQGTTRLLDYRRPGSDGPPVLLVPSLINRSYILDLSQRRSLARGLASRGLSPFLVDWDAPGEQERRFTLTDYIAGRLEQVLDVVIAQCGAKPALVGYCMGGDLALALALRRQADVKGLALLATPWNFHAGREAHGKLLRALSPSLNALVDNVGAMPVDILQALFASLDPGLTAKKFAAFARLKRRSARARDFVALEDWANDGVELAGPVALECLIGWYGDNDTHQGRWKVDGRLVDPTQLQVPTLAVIPERDRIVPPDSAAPLAAAIKGAKTMIVRGGHVGMLLSARAGTEVYTPLARWLKRSLLQ